MSSHSRPVPVDLANDNPVAVALALGATVIRPSRSVGTVDPLNNALSAAVDPQMLSFIVRLLPPPGVSS